MHQIRIMSLSSASDVGADEYPVGSHLYQGDRPDYMAQMMSEQFEQSQNPNQYKQEINDLPGFFQQPGVYPTLPDYF